MKIRYELDRLITNSVSVKMQNYTEINGKVYDVGRPIRRAFVNSSRGRSEVSLELPQVQQNAIFAVWGNEPTVDETE